MWFGQVLLESEQAEDILKQLHKLLMTKFPAILIPFLREAVTTTETEPDLPVTDICFTSSASCPIQYSSDWVNKGDISLTYPIEQTISLYVRYGSPSLRLSTGLRACVPIENLDLVKSKMPHPYLKDSVEITKRFDLGGDFTYLRKIPSRMPAQCYQNKDYITSICLTTDESLPQSDEWHGRSCNIFEGRKHQPKVFILWKFARRKICDVDRFVYEELHVLLPPEKRCDSLEISSRLKRLGRAHAYMYYLLTSSPSVGFMQQISPIVTCVYGAEGAFAPNWMVLLVILYLLIPILDYFCGVCFSENQVSIENRPNDPLRPTFSLVNLDRERMSSLRQPIALKLYLRNVLLKGILRWGEFWQLKFFTTATTQFYKDLYEGPENEEKQDCLWTEMDDTTSTVPTFVVIEAVRYGKAEMVKYCLDNMPYCFVDVLEEARKIAVNIASTAARYDLTSEEANKIVAMLEEKFNIIALETLVEQNNL